MSGKWMEAALAAVAVASPRTASATVLGYWQFENTPGFLVDSGPGGRTLTSPGGAATPTQSTLQGSGAGSGFSNAIAGTSKAANFNGSQYFQRADEAAFTDTSFTVEALINGSDFATNSSTKAIVGQWNATGSVRSWLMAVGGSGASASLNFLFSTTGANTTTLQSGLSALQQGKDYFVAVTVDMTDTSTSGITFYEKNLTDNLPMEVSGVAHSGTSFFNSSASLTIGSTDQPSSQFTGLIDEVRYSDAKLAGSDLLVAAPEPSSLALLAGTGLAMRNERVTIDRTRIRPRRVRAIPRDAIMAGAALVTLADSAKAVGAGGEGEEGVHGWLRSQCTNDLRPRAQSSGRTLTSLNRTTSPGSWFCRPM
jgi:hypothetical protein